MINDKPKSQTKEALMGALKIFKANSPLILSISMIGVLVTGCSNTLQFLQNEAYQRFSLLFMPLFLVTFLWLQIVLIKTTSKLYRDETVTLKEAFLSPLGRFWRTFRVALTYGIFIFLPIIIAMLIARVYSEQAAIANLSDAISDHPHLVHQGFHIPDLWVVVLIYGVALIPSIYLAIKFVFALSGAVLEAKTVKPFSNCRAIMRNNFWQVFRGVLVVVGLIFLFPFAVNMIVASFFRNIPTMAKYLISMGLLVYNIFSFPIQIMFITLLYMKTKDRYDSTHQTEISEEPA